MNLIVRLVVVLAALTVVGCGSFLDSNEVEIRAFLLLWALVFPLFFVVQLVCEKFNLRLPGQDGGEGDWPPIWLFPVLSLACGFLAFPWDFWTSLF